MLRWPPATTRGDRLNDSRSVPGDKAPHDTAVERARAALAGLSDLLRTGKLDEPTKAAIRRAIASTEADRKSVV